LNNDREHSKPVVKVRPQQPASFEEDAGDIRHFRLLCAALSRDAGSRAQTGEALSDPATSDAVIALAIREGVAPALHQSVEACFRGQVPKLLRMVLATQFEANRRRNREIRSALLPMAAEAGKRGIELIALKGAAWVVEDPDGMAAWRSMVDFDVLVEPEHFGRMPSVLHDLGYYPASFATRFRNNFHHAPFQRRGDPATVEVHRHLGWRHELLDPAVVRGGAQLVGEGLWLPAPWCRAFHAVIHWQIQDCGLSRRTARLKDIVEVSRFLARSDVDWGALLFHARRVGAEPACEAAVALAAELLSAPVPNAIALTGRGRRHVRRALARRASPFGTWLATEMWRAGTLWRCEKVAYRAALRGAGRVRVATAMIGGRAIRLPLLMARIAWIGFRAFEVSRRTAVLR
jgi:hypothetical protein